MMGAKLKERGWMKYTELRETKARKRFFKQDGTVLRTVPADTEVFLPRFMTMREKQILARATGIQKENLGGGGGGLTTLFF